MYNTSIPVDLTCSEDNTTAKVRVNYNFQRDGIPSVFVITGNGSVGNVVSTFKNAAPLYAETVTVSTNAATALNVVWNNDTEWLSEETDHDAFVQFSYSNLKHFTLLLVEFSKLGIVSHGFFIPIQGIVQVSNSTDDTGWVDVAYVAGKTANGSQVEEIELGKWGKSIRVFAKAPIGVKVFLPFSDQDCFENEHNLTGVQLFISKEQVFSQSLIASVLANGEPADDCVCTDTCTLSGFSAVKDGICQDAIFKGWDRPYVKRAFPIRKLSPDQVLQIYFGVNDTLDAGLRQNGSVYTWYANSTTYNISTSDVTSFFSSFFYNDTSVVNFTGNASLNSMFFQDDALVVTQEIYILEHIQEGIQYCYAGQDCSDCGSSQRKTQRDPASTCEFTDTQQFIYSVFGNSSLDTNHLFVLRELIQPLSFVQFQVNVTQSEKVVFSPKCVNLHPVVTCGDGSAALTKDRCPVTLHECPGDGCTELPNTRSRVCSCRTGHGGRDCSYDYCEHPTPDIDITKSKVKLVDPAKWCTCQRRHGGRLVIRPPFSYDSTLTILTVDQLIAINRKRRPRKNANDVGYHDVQYTDAPFGRPVLMKLLMGNQTIVTNCQPVVQDRTGRYLTLEDCVESRAADGTVLEWKTLYEDNGQPYTIVWPHEFYWNDLPYPCKQGSCMKNPAQCYQEERDRPLCNGNGRCRVDGSCECAKGKETFVVNDDISKRAKYPYFSDNPTIWGFVDHRQYSDLYCKARNCSEVDCTRRKACYPGSIKNEFKDKLFTCPDTTNFAGLCAPDLASCKAGTDLSEPTDCGSNGYLVRVENRPYEMVCLCGLPPFQLQTGAVIKDSTNLIPNGFGGPLCTEHLCTESKDKIYFERVDPQTGLPYVDEFGDVLPGKWRGPCGAPAGFAIEDIGNAISCCSKESNKRLEHCRSTLCTINGVQQCVPIEECQGAQRIPNIHVCNNHADTLADGTCLCNYDELTGVGYTSDHTHYSDEGCFALIRCPISELTGTPCGRCASNECLRYWSRWPPKQYMEQQIYAFLLKQGLPPTDKSAVMVLYPNAAKRDREVYNAAVDQAKYGLDEVAAVLACVAVGPNDTTSSYCCMANNKVPPPLYGEAFNRPYLLNGNVTLSNENARFLFTTYRFVETFRFRYRIGELASPLQVTFNTGAKFVDVIRIRVTYNQSTPSSANFRFTLSDGSSYKSDLIPASPNTYRWIEMLLLERWQEIDLTSFTQWVIKCKPDPSSLLCTSWFDPVCVLEGGVVQLPETLAQKDGCSGRCCKLVQSAPAASTYVRIDVDSETVGTDVNLYVHAIDIYGHGTTRLPVPENLKSELEVKTGTSECLDEFFLNHRDTKLCGLYSYFLGRNFPEAKVVQNLNFDQAKEQCESSGSSLAVTLGGEQLSNYARQLGAACYGRKADSASVCDDLPVTGVENGCLIGAQESSTPLNPTNDFFIKPSCLVNGCYIIGEGLATENGLSPIFAYAPSEDHGTSWKTPSPTLPTQPAWNLVFSEWFNRQKRTAIYKANNYVMSHCFPDNPAVTGTAGNIALCAPLYSDSSKTCLLQDLKLYSTLVSLDTVNSYYTEVKIPGSDRDGLVTGYTLSAADQQTYVAIQQGTADTIPNIFEQETSSQLCEVTVWDQAMCGVFTYGTTINPALQPDLFNGCCPRSVAAKKVFLVQPGTYQAFLHKDLSRYTFDECEDGSSTCKGRGKQIYQNGWSFAVNGPCDVTVSDDYGTVFTSDTQFPNPSRKPRRGSRQHSKPPDDKGFECASFGGGS